MSDRVVRIDVASHKVAHVLLPWFVNGTLKEDELAFVRRHLDECVDCRQEVDWLRELRAACIAGETMPGASPVFRNLRHQLEGPREGAASIARLRPSGRGVPHWWPWAVAAQFATIILLGGLLLASPDDPSLYRTLGDGDRGTPATGSLVVVFDPSISLAELQRILQSAGALIVDGPTQANGYVLEVPPGKTDQALQAIRSERAALLVEPLGLRAGR